MIKKGEIEILKNMKNVVFLIKLSFIKVFDYLAYTFFVVYSKKMFIAKFMMNMMIEQKIWPT